MKKGEKGKNRTRRPTDSGCDLRIGGQMGNLKGITHRAMKTTRTKIIRRGLLALLLLILGTAGILLFHTFTFESRQLQFDPVAPRPIPPTSVRHFSEALQIPTISPEELEDFDSTHFQAFNEFLVRTYPLADSLLDHRTFNDFAHLYHWKGSNPDLKPIILATHLDVVPVIEENRSDWRQAPFGGQIVADTVWGRGAIDDKNRVIAALEAVELMLSEGFRPARGLYLTLGHDEEIGGLQGAQATAKYLKSQGVEAEFILDEGGYITQGIIPGLEQDVALIGTSEKGYLSMELSVKVEGGHSSIPAQQTAIDVLAKAILNLKENPFPARISPSVAQFIDYVGPEQGFVNRMAFANSSVFKSLIIATYEEKASGNAMVRTTTAPTIFQGGVKDNVVPQVARAVVNFRILPGETIETVTERVQSVIADEHVVVMPGDHNDEPAVTSPTDGQGFQLLQRTIGEVYPEALVSPYLMVGITDSRHYRELAPHTYRFSPIRITEQNIKSFHGLNERLSVPEFEQSIRFFVRLFENGLGEEN